MQENQFTLKELRAKKDLTQVQVAEIWVFHPRLIALGNVIFLMLQ